MTEQLRASEPSDPRAVDEVLQRMSRVFREEDPLPLDHLLRLHCPNVDALALVQPRVEGKSWNDPTIERALYEIRNELQVLSPQGQRYFLPAIMRAVLTRFENVDSLRENVVHMLSRAEQSPVEMKEAPPLVSLLSPHEKAVVRDFLAILREREEFFGTCEVFRECIDEALEVLGAAPPPRLT